MTELERLKEENEMLRAQLKQKDTEIERMLKSKRNAVDFLIGENDKYARSYDEKYDEVWEEIEGIKKRLKDLESETGDLKNAIEPKALFEAVCEQAKEEYHKTGVNRFAI